MPVFKPVKPARARQRARAPQRQTKASDIIFVMMTTILFVALIINAVTQISGAINRPAGYQLQHSGASL
jgi:hypothetical protein